MSYTVVVVNNWNDVEALTLLGMKCEAVQGRWLHTCSKFTERREKLFLNASSSCMLKNQCPSDFNPYFLSKWWCFVTIWQIQKLFILLWVRKDCRVTENSNTKYFTDMLHCLKSEVSQWKLKIVLWNLRSSKIVLLLELCTVVNPFFFLWRFIFSLCADI